MNWLIEKQLLEYIELIIRRNKNPTGDTTLHHNEASHSKITLKM